MNHKIAAPTGYIDTYHICFSTIMCMNPAIAFGLDPESAKIMHIAPPVTGYVPSRYSTSLKTNFVNR